MYFDTLKYIHVLFTGWFFVGGGFYKLDSNAIYCNIIMFGLYFICYAVYNFHLIGVDFWTGKFELI